MAVIFFGKKRIILTDKVSLNTNFNYRLLKNIDIQKEIVALENLPITDLYLVKPNSTKILKTFLKLLPNVTAGGGKVYNAKNDVLFIYRNNKWDLPKGKAEKKESIEETSIREVEEETGVKGLEIIAPLLKTYHIYKHQGTYKIKITHWFEMKTKHTDVLVPQEKEGITKVKWCDEKEITKALKKSYGNIKLLF